MNKKEIKQRIEVMQAYLDGKTIQCLDGGDWLEIKEPTFQTDWEYRIKPEPSVRWVNFYRNWEAGCSWGTKAEADSQVGAKIALLKITIEDNDDVKVEVI